MFIYIFIHTVFIYIIYIIHTHMYFFPWFIHDALSSLLPPYKDRNKSLVLSSLSKLVETFWIPKELRTRLHAHPVCDVTQLPSHLAQAASPRQNPRDDIFRSPTRRALPSSPVPEAAWCHRSPRKGASPCWPRPPAPCRSGRALQPALCFQLRGQREASVSPPPSAEAVRLEAEWKGARSSLGGVPGAAAGFGLALGGTEASVPDGGLVAVCCGPACYSALRGAQQPRSVR